MRSVLYVTLIEWAVKYSMFTTVFEATVKVTESSIFEAKGYEYVRHCMRRRNRESTTQRRLQTKFKLD